MIETFTVIGLLGLATLTALLGVRWWLNHPGPAVLGETDLSQSLHQMLRWAAEGGRITLSATDRRAVVVFRKHSEREHEDELEVELTSHDLDESGVSDFCDQLKLLGISVRGDRRLATREMDCRSLRITADLPRDARDCGRMADAALGALGLHPGDRYRYRFDGGVDSQSLRQDALAAGRMGRATAPHEWQSGIFDRLLKILKSRS